MSSNQPTVWCVRGGSKGQADSLFLEKNVVALGGEPLGDLSDLPKNRDAFKKRFGQAFPDVNPASVPTGAGKYYRFLHKIRESDLVVYPSKIDHDFHIGRITGPYVFDRSDLPDYPHRRPVEWLKSVPRTLFSQSALFELRSLLTLFQVTNSVKQVIAALEGQASSPASEDEPEAVVTSDIEGTTRDFVIKRLERELKGYPLQDFVAHLLTAMGFETQVQQAGADGGIDVIAHRDKFGFEPPLIKVQVKSSLGNTGDPEVSALYGKVGAQEFGLLVTLGGFTKQARTFAREKSNLRLVDGDELVRLIFEHYDQLDSKYKGLIPLKRVYIPEQVGDADE